MNLRIFLFKLLAIVIQTFKLMLLFTPVVLSIRAFRAEHFYFMDELQAALFISFGLGMAVTIYNAFEFENFRHLELTQYMKTNQHYKTTLSDKVNASDMLSFIEKTAAQKGYTLLARTDHGLEFEIKSPYRFKDKLSVQLKGQEVLISSKPRNIFWPIDLGRNYKNILGMLLVIKQMPVSI